MELLDYLRAIRRSWLIVVAATVVGGVVGALYLTGAPKAFEASTRIVVTANGPVGIQDSQAGADLASSITATVAGLIDSPIVLEPAAQALGTATTASDLESMVTVSTQLATGLLTATVTASSAELAADAAAAVAQAAVEIVPGSVGGENSTGDDALRLDVISQPAVPSAPSSPRAQGVMVLAVLIGASAGLAVAIVRFVRDGTIRGVADLQPSGIPTLAAVPLGPPHDAPEFARDVVVPPAYQELRSRILRGSRTEHPSTLVVPLSAGRADAWPPLQLAATFARSTRRTLLIDLDGYTRGASRLLSVEDRPGAMEVLAGLASPEDVAVATDEEDLWVMPAGVASGTPADVLERPTLAPLLRWAEGHYDVVVVNAPAIGAHPDATIVAGAVGHVAIAVRSGTDSIRALRSTVTNLEAAGATVAGAVLVTAHSR